MSKDNPTPSQDLRVRITAEANCSFGHDPKEYAAFLNKIMSFYYPQHHFTVTACVAIGGSNAKAEPFDEGEDLVGQPEPEEENLC